ncbi:hypothetical protein OG310_13055 [Streptomyces sp. NBC_01497]|nr:hypothetical protein [Streptomyces sp. NBC_01497]
MHIGSVTSSALNIGDHGTVTNVHHHRPPDADAAQEELLAAVRELRADLARLVRTEGTDALDAELSRTEDEVTAAGAATPGRLARLREALGLAGAITGSLASGVAVARSISGLLGG